MKILIVYPKFSKIESYADSLRRGAESKGHHVTVKTTDSGSEMITCSAFDLLIVGSPINGFFGGQVSGELKTFLSGIKRTEGQAAIAFTNRKIFGTDKALKVLMGMMESQGCIVKDFRAFNSPNEACEYGRQI